MEVLNNDLNNSMSPLAVNSPGEPRLAGLSSTIRSEVKSGGRLDRFGNVIQKRVVTLSLQKTMPVGEKRKKKDKNRHKVSFVDKIEHDRELVSTVFVLSQKKYNALNTFDGPFETEPE